MYKIPKYHKSQLKGIETTEGEPLEWKIERIMTSNEPITDGAPEIFTERKEGVNAAYNIRTDRWELAAEAMDVVQKNVQAKRDARAEKKEAKVVKLKKDSEAKSTEGTND